MSWTTTQINDPLRQTVVQIPVTSVKAVSGTVASLANVVENEDISAAYAGAFVEVDSGDIDPIPGFRTLAFKGTDASGTTLVIQVVIEGQSLFGRSARETFTLNTGNSWFYETQYAYTGTVRIWLKTTAAAASDLVDVAMASFGVPIWSKNLQSVILSEDEDGYHGGMIVLTIGTDVIWNDDYSVLDTDEIDISAGDVIHIYAYQDKTTDPSFPTLAG
jgi:hypothetical protein